ncbi:MAG: hypothetical protein ACTSRP_06270 [Candidatus Helarchaeota archaeon]
MDNLSENDKIFIYGLKIENIVEYIESKVLDAFFGYKHNGLENSSDLFNNLINWVWRLKQEFKKNSYLSESLTNKILEIVDRIDEGVRNLKIAVEDQAYNQGNIEIEKILKAIREFYDLRKV